MFAAALGGCAVELFGPDSLIGLRGRAGAQTTEGELRKRVNVKRRRTLDRVGAFAALLLACVWVAGCGNDGTDQLTKAEFLKQGNAICAKGTGQIDAAGTTAFASPGNPTEQETAAFATEIVVPNVQDQVDQLRALSPPTGDEAQVKAILDQAQRAVDEVRTNPRLLGRETASEEANRIARAYGLTACAG